MIDTMRSLAAVVTLSVSLLIPVVACGQSSPRAPVTSVSHNPLAEPTQRVIAGPVEPDPRVGAVFLGGGDLHTCTGSVLHSAGGDLVLTAAHCLGGDIKSTTFVPGLAGNVAPADLWTVDAVYLDPRWVAGKDPHADYVIARVSHAAGGSVEEQADSGLSLGTAPAPGSRISVMGYPAGVGGKPIGCQASTGMADGYPSLACSGLVDGTSGGPWISGSTVTGLVGGLDGGGCGEHVSYSPPLDDHTAQLLARAEAGGPGDTPPAVVDDECS
jgi:hypothetical protein